MYHSILRFPTIYVVCAYSVIVRILSQYYCFQMIADIMDDFFIALEVGRIFSADYFIYNRERRSFETDYRFSTKLMIIVRIIGLTITVYLSLPPYNDLNNLIILFQAVESLTIYILSISLFIINYKCQVYNVKTYKALIEIEKMFLELNLEVYKNFKRNLKRIVYIVTLIFVVNVTSADLFCVYNGVLDFLSVLTVTTAVVSFYKTASFIIVFLIIWQYYQTINRYLEKLYFKKGNLKGRLR